MSRASLIGKQLEHYDIERHLGIGSQGEVWRAFDRSENRIVAIKILHREVASNPALLSQFQAEARTHRLLEHPHIVRVYGTFTCTHEGETIHAMAMECAEGDSLETLLTESDQGFLSPEFAVQVICAAAHALNYAHGKRVLHRDIKPSNIIATDDAYRIQVADFGLSEQDETQTQIHGTPAYLAPEIAAGAPASEASDIYALGATFYHLLYGAAPFVADKEAQLFHMHANTPVGFPDKKTFSGERLLRKTIKAMCAKRPADRPDLASVISALDHFLGKSHHASSSAAIAPSSLKSDTSSIDHQTRLVGRRVELQSIHRALANDARLITLHGPAGIGKTRIAHAFLETIESDRQIWGMHFVALRDATDRTTLLSAIGSSIGLSHRSADQLEAIVASLRSRGRTIVVFDSIEHLLSDAVEIIPHLLDSAPRLVVLATSSESLNLEREWRVAIGPLSTIRERFALNIDAPSPARELFDASFKARNAVDPSFDSSEDDALDHLLERMGGIPLAIEMVAAKASQRKPSELLATLEDFEESDDALASAIRWSWELLDRAEASVCAQLSIIRGGFTIEAAESIVRLSDALGDLDMLDILDSLVAKSLVSAQSMESGELRFHMLEPFANFARQESELTFSKEHVRSLRERHRAYYLGYAKELADSFARTHQRPVFIALQAEIPNLIFIVEHARQHQEEVESALHALTLLDGPLIQNGRARFLYDALEDLMQMISLSRLSEILSRPGMPRVIGLSYIARAEALRVLGESSKALVLLDEGERFAQEQIELLADEADHLFFDINGARTNIFYSQGRHQEGLELTNLFESQAQNDHQRAKAHFVRGGFLLGLGKVSEAIIDLRLAESAFEQAKDQLRLARVRNSIGMASSQSGLHREAVAAFESVEEIAKAHGDQDLFRTALSNAAAVYCILGEHAKALRAHKAVAAICRRNGDAFGLAIATGGIGEVAFETKELATAENNMRQAIEHARGAGAQHVEAYFTFALSLVRIEKMESINDQAQVEAIAQEAIHALSACQFGDSVFQSAGTPDEAIALAGLALAAARLQDPRRSDWLAQAKQSLEAFEAMLSEDHFRLALIEEWIRKAEAS